jgi:dTDP-4-dehydrorhamnose reductase
MKVAVIGCNGMLGTDLVAACRTAGIEVLGLDLPGFDITKFEGVRANLPEVDRVVNCAAYTRVDDAESQRDQAYAVNAEGAGNVARICSARNIGLLQISTDYVFDGRKGSAYSEDDPVNPLSIYGASKLAGEELVRGAGGRSLIVRTQSLFGLRGANFVRTIAQRLKRSDEPLRVVNDQFSSPTYTRHLAAAIVRLLQLDREGIVNVTASGFCSWFEFAQAIAARVKPGAGIIPVGAVEYPRPATRPAYSVLDAKRYREWTGSALPSWQKGLDEYLAEEKLA